jgi:hypothetical protein
MRRDEASANSQFRGMRIPLVISLVTLASAFACSGSSTPTGFADPGTGGSGSGSGGSGSGGGSGGAGSSGGGSGSSSGVNLGGSVNNDASTGQTSGDGGFVCDPNPLNYDILGNGCDDDGDGHVDNVILCDSTVPTGPSASTATQILNAMEVCHAADATHWGIVSASLNYGYSTGSQVGAGDSNFAYQYGVLQTFGSGGVKSQEGAAFGLLSSGTADINDTQDNGPYFKGSKNGMQQNTDGAVPPGFPQTTKSGCQPASDVHDVVDLNVQLKVPANAKGLQFDFNFYSGEWPEYVCSSFNDSFIAYLKSEAFNSGSPGNISFDTNGNPVSVNIGFFNVCSPAPAVTGCDGTVGSASCTAGAGALTGTGFDDSGQYCTTSGQPVLIPGLSQGGQTASGGGSTGWLTSTAPVKAGETITLDFIIWDTGDAQYDSSVLMDYLTWQGVEVPAMPITQPSPPPK